MSNDIKKTYLLYNLDCAGCASKITDKLNKKDYISNATIDLITNKLTITGNSIQENFEDIKNTISKIDSGVTLKEFTKKNVAAQNSKIAAECDCGHDHYHSSEHNGHTHSHSDESFGNDHDHEGSSKPKMLILGAIIYAIAFITEKLLPAQPIFSTILFFIAYFILGYKVLWSAIKNISRGGIFDENFLMSIATIGAFFLGQNEEAVAVMLFYQIGEYFEDKAVEKSRKEIMSAIELRPDNALILREGQEISVDASDVQVGDTIILKAGERVPLDGVVIKGSGTVDNSAITGESVPQDISIGSEVLSGAINNSGLIHLQVTKPLSESMITRVLDIVENANQNKPKTERFITKFSKIYTPIVCLLAVIVAVVPPLIGLGSFDEWIYKAITFLVVSCPCALVLSVPMTFFAGVGKGSRQGILFKGGAPMETLINVKSVLFDKTGTITTGEFGISEMRVNENYSPDQLIEYAAIAEKTSTHPIAQCIIKDAQARNIIYGSPEITEEIAGKGVIAEYQGNVILCGSLKLLKENNINVSFTTEKSAFYVSFNQDFVGYVIIEDQIKDDARYGISNLKAMGIDVGMLTGDSQEIANNVANQVGITNVYAKLNPEQKLETLQKERAKNDKVMFVGDGINDAPVISSSDVGAAMGSGSDIAIESADIVLLNKKVQAVPEAFKIAKYVRKISTQNITLAIATKIAAMVLSIFGITTIWIAVFADTGVALLCVMNSLRVLTNKK